MDIRRIGAIKDADGVIGNQTMRAIQQAGGMPGGAPGGPSAGGAGGAGGPTIEEVD